MEPVGAEARRKPPCEVANLIESARVYAVEQYEADIRMRSARA